MLLLGCTTPEPPAPPPPADAVEVGPGERLVELVMDRGRFDDGAWVSEPVGDDALVEPVAKREPGEGTLARAWAVLPIGPGVARVRRACGTVEVPYTVGVEQTVILPYPGCDARPDGLVAWGDVARMHALGMLGEVAEPGPGEDDLPARWITLDEARAYCAWFGERLPVTTTAGPIDEWLADGRIATKGGVRDVPDNARTETIGFRCVP